LLFRGGHGALNGRGRQEEAAGEGGGENVASGSVLQVFRQNAGAADIAALRADDAPRQIEPNADPFVLRDARRTVEAFKNVRLLRLSDADACVRDVDAAKQLVFRCGYGDVSARWGVFYRVVQQVSDRFLRPLGVIPAGDPFRDGPGEGNALFLSTCGERVLQLRA
jgi:hypothetical protein